MARPTLIAAIEPAEKSIDEAIEPAEDAETAIGGACHSVYTDSTALAAELQQAMCATADYSLAPHVIAAHRVRLESVRVFVEARRERMTPGERRAVRILAREATALALPAGDDGDE